MVEQKLSARKYLEQLQELDVKINQDLEDLAQMRAKVYSISGIDYSDERIQTSSVGDLSSAVTRIITRNEQVNAEIDRFVDAKNQIISEIRGLHVTGYVAVLYKVYVQFKTVRQAAKELGLSYYHVSRLHTEALEAFEEAYDDLHYLT